MDRETRLKKLRFRAWRRGFREHDFLMGTYADTSLRDQDESGLEAFEALLNEADWDVYYWIVGQIEPPERHRTAVLQGLQALRFSVETIAKAT